MKLSSLKYDYAHARIMCAEICPRREARLSIEILEWEGQNGHYSVPKALRFGGISNIEEVERFFIDHVPLELSWLGYSEAHVSKPGAFLVKVVAERSNSEMLITCSTLSVD